MMVLRRWSLVVCVVCSVFGSVAFGLTDPTVKYPDVKIYLESTDLEWQAPDWFASVDLATAPEGFDHWREVLPYPEHRNEDLYLVIPQLGVVTPIVTIPEGSNDNALMTNGHQIDINKYLTNGAIEYVQSVNPGEWGKRIDFAHSNFRVDQPGDFKTIFSTIMRLDAGDEVWYYKRNISGQYDLYTYRVSASYPTSPSNVGALARDGEGADGLLVACTDGLNGRWLIETEYLGTPIRTGTQEDLYDQLSASMQTRITRAVHQVAYLNVSDRKVLIIGLVNTINTRLESNPADYDRQLLEFVKDALLDIYPA